MPTNILMPALSPTMTEGNLAKWHVKEGDMVEAGDVIAEIETDKATMEVEAVDEGKVGKIIVPEGTSGVAVNQPIAVLLEEGESEADLNDVILSGSEGSNKQQKDSSPAAQNDKTTMVEAKAPASAQGDKKEETAGKPNGRVFASPLAKRLAAQAGIDLSAIKGTGPRGRIVKADIEKAKSGGVTAPARGAVMPQSQAPQVQGAGAGPDARALSDMLGMKYTEEPNSSVRRTIARRLLESKQTVPHFYLTIECRIDTLLAMRKEMNEQAGGTYKLSVNDFLIKACANALKVYPDANVAWTEAAILKYEHADISMAVATPNGLITPIIKAAETKGLKQISEEAKDLAGRARDGKLKPEEFQGGTFTLSNLGMFGIQEFGAIINPPQACILAVGAGEEKPFVSNGEVRIGTFMKCTLSVDHRAVDGAVGAEYLKILKQYIENPASMLL